VLPATDSSISTAGNSVEVVVHATNASLYWLINEDAGQVIAGPQADNHFSIQAYADGNYAAQVSGTGSNFTSQATVDTCRFSLTKERDWTCTLTRDEQNENLVTVAAEDVTGRSVDRERYKVQRMD
jgi:hypothetical protein